MNDCNHIFKFLGSEVQEPKPSEPSGLPRSEHYAVFYCTKCLIYRAVLNLVMEQDSSGIWNKVYTRAFDLEKAGSRAARARLDRCVLDQAKANVLAKKTRKGKK